MKETYNLRNGQDNLLSPEQMNLIDLNLELTVEERLQQLQSAVDLIEEMRASVKESNENRLQNSNK